MGPDLLTLVILLISIVLEVSGTTCMKLSDGFSKTLPSVGMVVFYLLSLALMSVVLKKMDVSLAYAIWAGAGTALIACIGIFWFKEPVTALKMVSLSLVIAGVVGLNLSGGAH